MLSVPELVIYAFLLLVLLPIIVWSLLQGSPAPQGPLGKYYRAQPYLNLAGNLMVLFLCALALVRLLRHFGVIDADLGQRLADWIDLPIVVFLLVFAALWIAAFFKVRRGAGA